MKEKMTETELAGAVVKWLEKTSHDVYPEIVIKGFGGRPDLAAVRNGIVKIIECKVNTNLTVVEQAVRWRNPHRNVEHGMPHLIIIAVQNYTFGSESVLKMIVKQMGIGVIEVRKHSNYRHGNERLDPEEVAIGDYIYRIQERVAPRIQPGSRRFGSRLIEQLNPDMKIATPGARGGFTEYMTPFKRTMNLVAQVVADGREWHCQTIVNVINMMGGHHYSSDKGCAKQIYALCHLINCEPGSLPHRIRLKINENLPNN